MRTREAKTKRALVIYPDRSFVAKVDAFANRTGRTRSAAAALLLEAGLAVIDKPIGKLLAG
jgi:hypothetical protein